MEILKELWYGNIQPNEFSRKRSKERQEILNLLIRHRNTLDTMLTEEQKAVLDKYRECQTELSCLDECEVFIRGFRLGMMISVDVLHNGDKAIPDLE